MSLHLHVTEFQDETRWRWELRDEKGAYLGDHEVKVGGAPEVRGYLDLPRYLENRPPDEAPKEGLRRVGEWMGREVFGTVLSKIGERLDYPATVVQVHVPKEAQALLHRPFELAHLDGKPLAETGVRFVYQFAGAAEPKAAKPSADRLRMLAVFSLPHGENPLNLRRERVELERFLKNLTQTRSATVELRVLQYGATRETLKDALLEGDGWDLIHFSGHGLAGELVLENQRGEADRMDADDLVQLLRPARRRLKLLTLSSCLSGAGTVAAARRRIGLNEPTREAAVEKEPDAAETACALPSLGQNLAEELDCAVLAMRYKVGDTFARETVLGLYEMLLEKEQPLPSALQIALKDALRPDPTRPAGIPSLSLVTPILFGPRAAVLSLAVPRTNATFVLPQTGLQGFPPLPERFVGRLLPMLRASQALAPESPYRGVLFHGMAGAGKTACALELAYRHEDRRFPGPAWSKAPDLGQDIVNALTQFALDLERQLPGLDLVGLLDDPQDMRTKALPRLKGLLQGGAAVLIVIDNLESLLSDSGDWRDSRWGDLIKTLLDHSGTSRVVLTSRMIPADLDNHPALLREPINTLSFPESVLLTGELPHLASLFVSPAGKKRLQHILAAAQGHPKLLELANALQGTDPEALDRRLEMAGEKADLVDGGPSRFFSIGETTQGPAVFVKTLEGWTVGITSNLSSTARLLFHVLCHLEEIDRSEALLTTTWPRILNRLRVSSSAAAAALAEPQLGLPAALERLDAVGLLEIQRLSRSERKVEMMLDPGKAWILFCIHPAVAETGRQKAARGVGEASDQEMSAFWLTIAAKGIETEMQGGGQLIVQAGKRGVPYLIRLKRWKEVTALLQWTIQRDQSTGTLAMALPLLRELVGATQATPDELANLDLLANTLQMAGRYAEAEEILRRVLETSKHKGLYRVGSVAASHLTILLQKTSRFEEALEVIECMVEFTRNAGLGRWSQILDESMRLDVLGILGRHSEVLDEVVRLWEELERLPPPAENEVVESWYVRETLLFSGFKAALQLHRWDAALSLTAETLRTKAQRGAYEVELARTAMDQYYPLIKLHKIQEARNLLELCRETFETYNEVRGLGKVYGALAELEATEGHHSEAVRFAKSAIRHLYQSQEPEYCATSHNNLAHYLQHSQAESADVFAHFLAAGAIWYQISSESLRIALRNLSNSSLGSFPSSFDEIIRRVEETDGIRFRELFDRLPKRVVNGDAAVAEIWRLVQEKREILLSVPSAVQQAIEIGDEEALYSALGEIPQEESSDLLEKLVQADILFSKN